MPTSLATEPKTYDVYTDEYIGFYKVTEKSGSKFSYNDHTLYINAGDTVEWINEGDMKLTIVIMKEGIVRLSASISKNISPLLGMDFDEVGIYEVYIKEYPNFKRQNIIVNNQNIIPTETVPVTVIQTQSTIKKIDIGYVYISTNMGPADMYIDGKYVGGIRYGEEAIFELSLGSHLLKVIKDNYESEKEFMVRAGDITRLRIILWHQRDLNESSGITPAVIETYPSIAINSPNPNVYLYGDRTDIELSQDAIFILSAVNIISKPTMTVQIILMPPSGMAVTSSEFSTTTAGQYSAKFDVQPGEGKNIEIRLRPNQVGNFSVTGRVIYYFGKETEYIKDDILNLSVKVKDNEVAYSYSEETSTLNKNKTIDGFEGIFGMGILTVFYTIFKRQKDEKYK